RLLPSYTFFSYRSVALPPLPSFPTLRSSDLDLEPAAIDRSVGLERRLDVGGPADELDPEARRQVAQGQHCPLHFYARRVVATHRDRKSTRLNSSHVSISYAVFCLKKKTQ